MTAEKSKPPRTPRAQIRRILSIFNILARARSPLKVSQIKERLIDFGLEKDDTGLSDRNIQRDLQFIRDEMGYDVSTVPGEGYLMESRSDGRNELLPLYFDKTEIQALIMGRELFSPFQKTHLGDAIESVYEKILKCYTGKRTPGEGINTLEDIFMIQPPSTRRYKSQKDLFKNVVSAISHSQVINIKHKNGYEFEVNPYRFVIHNDTLYLLAVPANGDEADFRLYLLPRIIEVTLRDKNFTRVSLEQIEGKFKYAWKIYLKGEPAKISIVFDAKMQEYLEERIWHPSQKFTLVDGSVEMELHILLNDEIVHWILGFGKAVKNVKPPELAQMVKEMRE